MHHANSVDSGARHAVSISSISTRVGRYKEAARMLYRLRITCGVPKNQPVLNRVVGVSEIPLWYVSCSYKSERSRSFACVKRDGTESIVGSGIYHIHEVAVALATRESIHRSNTATSMCPSSSKNAL